MTPTALSPPARPSAPPDVRPAPTTAVLSSVRRLGAPRAFAVCLFVLLAVVLPLLITRRQNGALDASYAVQLIVMVFSAGGLAHAIALRPGDLMNFGFWIFGYVWMGLAPFVMVAWNSYPLPSRYPDSVVTMTSVVVLVGFVGYVGGSSLVSLRGDPPAGPLSRTLERTLVPWRVAVLCVLTVALAAVAIPALGGAGALLSSRQDANDVTELLSEASGGQVRSALLGWGLSVCSFIALLSVLHLRKRVRDIAWWTLLVAVLLTLNVLANNPISQPRFWAGTVILGLIFSIPKLSQPRAFQIAALVVIAAVLLVFPYSDYFRYEKRNTPTVQSIGQQFTNNGDFDAFEMTETGVAMVSERGLQPSMALGPALFWVPRTVWPDKPGSVGSELAEYAGYEFTLRSSPLWIESYVWGGPAIVLVVFAVLGAANRVVDRARRLARRGSLAVVLVPPLAFFQVMVLRGSLVAVMAPLTLLLLLPPLLCGRRTPIAGTWADDDSETTSARLASSRQTALDGPAPGRGETS